MFRGARHGQNMSAKLKRVEEAEKKYMEEYLAKQAAEELIKQERLHPTQQPGTQLKQRKITLIDQHEAEVSTSSCQLEDNNINKKKKKKKKRGEEEVEACEENIPEKRKKKKDKNLDLTTPKGNQDEQDASFHQEKVERKKAKKRKHLDS